MEQILNEMNSQQDIPAFVHLDMEFHGLVMDAAGSPAPEAGLERAADGGLDLSLRRHHRLFPG